MAGVVGACSVLPGLLHVRAPWRGDSLAAAVSTGLVSWALSALAFGLHTRTATVVYKFRHAYMKLALLTVKKKKLALLKN
jgi:hypothetical protein